MRQITALDALGLFLEYAHIDDLVKNIKKILHYLMIVYINKSDNLVRDRLLKIIEQLAIKLPSPDIYLDVLLSRLENKHLTLEGDGSTTVMVILTFLTNFISAAPKDTASLKRVVVAIDKPYLKEYIVDHKENSQLYKHLKAIPF